MFNSKIWKNILLLSVLLTGCSSQSSSNSTSLSSSSITTTSTHKHTYLDNWSYNYGFHWHDSTCGHNVVQDKAQHTFNKVVTPATYECTGYVTYVCTICQYSYVEEIAKLKHSYSNSWSYNSTHHYHACIDSGYESLRIDETAHTFNDVVTDPTYDSQGYTTHTCTECGYSYVSDYTDVLKRKISITLDNYKQYLNCFILITRGTLAKDPWLGTKNAYYGITIEFFVTTYVGEYYKFEDLAITFSYEVSTYIYDWTVNPTAYTNKKLYQWRRGTETVSVPISGKYMQSFSFDDIYHYYDGHDMTVDSISGFAVEK